MTGDVSDMVRKIDIMDRLGRRHIATPEEYENVSHYLPTYLSPKSMEAYANHVVATRLARSGSKLTVPKALSPPGTLPPLPPERIICRVLTRHIEGRTLSRPKEKFLWLADR